MIIRVDGTNGKQSFSSKLLEKALSLIPIKNRKDPKVFEQFLKDTSKAYILPEKVRRKYGITQLDSFNDTFVIDHETNNNSPVIFYLHGGGYWVQPLSIHYIFFDKLAKKLGSKLILPIYPLAPAHNATQVHEMVMERYMYMINNMHISPQKIIFMGDSAGAGLAIAFMQVLRDKKLPLPKAAVLYSPWVDVTNTTPGMKDVPDPFLNVDNLAYGGEIYAGNLDPKDPLVSPIYGDMSNLPPIIAYGGTHDALNLDAEKMANMAEEQHFNFTLYVYDKMVHGFVGFFFTPEAKSAFKEIVKKINSIMTEETA
jgi:acetyl esterase/lipase